GSRRLTETKIALFRGKTAHGNPPMPSKRPSARFQPATREKRRPGRSVVASINPVEFSHGLLDFCTLGKSEGLSPLCRPCKLLRSGGLAKWERCGLQNRHERVRLPRPPPQFLQTVRKLGGLIRGPELRSNFRALRSTKARKISEIALPHDVFRLTREFSHGLLDLCTKLLGCLHNIGQFGRSHIQVA